MSNRVVLVNGNKAAADGAAEFIMGTYVGVGAVLYGVYWLVVFSFLLMPFWDTTSRILKVSGWL